LLVIARKESVKEKMELIPMAVPARAKRQASKKQVLVIPPCLCNIYLTTLLLKK
jgi:hypothetical protein